MKNNSEKKKGTVSKSVFELFGTLISALVIVVLVLTFVFRQVTVDGPSMEPTFFDGERLIITNTYGTMPENNDIIIVSHSDNYDNQFIKRVIATEGQTLSINFETNEVVVDGVLLNEPYIQGVTIQTDPAMEIPSVIPEGYVFVMGDNREVSLDSRSTRIGLIPVENIIGKVQMRIFPFDKFKFFGD